MLTAMFRYCGTSPTSSRKKTPPRCYARRRDLRSSQRSGTATADFLLLALVLHGFRRAEDLHAELAVRLADDFHGVLVLHDVARGGVDHHRAARAVRLPALHRVDHLVALGNLAAELFDGVDRKSTR